MSEQKRCAYCGEFYPADETDFYIYCSKYCEDMAFQEEFGYSRNDESAHD